MARFFDRILAIDEPEQKVNNFLFYVGFLDMLYTQRRRLRRRRGT